MKQPAIFLYSTVFTILFLRGNPDRAQSQILNKIISKATKTTATGTPSDQDISSGIKEALQQGIIKSSDQLSAVNGFFGNSAVKILFFFIVFLFVTQIGFDVGLNFFFATN